MRRRLRLSRLLAVPVLIGLGLGVGVTVGSSGSGRAAATIDPRLAASIKKQIDRAIDLESTALVFLRDGKLGPAGLAVKASKKDLQKARNAIKRVPANARKRLDGVDDLLLDAAVKDAGAGVAILDELAQNAASSLRKALLFKQRALAALEALTKKPPKPGTTTKPASTTTPVAFTCGALSHLAHQGTPDAITYFSFENCQGAAAVNLVVITVDGQGSAITEAIARVYNPTQTEKTTCAISAAAATCRLQQPLPASASFLAELKPALSVGTKLRAQLTTSDGKRGIARATVGS